MSMAMLVVPPDRYLFWFISTREIWKGLCTCKYLLLFTVYLSLCISMHFHRSKHTEAKKDCPAHVAMDHVCF